MCSPDAVAGAQAVSPVGGAILGFLGQGQAYKANVQAADVTYGNTANALAAQTSQINTQQSENTVTAMINAAAARGRISASASSMGADAASTAQQSNAADVDIGRDLSMKDINSENERVQVGQQLTGAGLARQSQINKVAKPNLLSLGFDIVGDIGQAAGTAMKLAAA